MDREREWADYKARDKSEIAMITDESREKVESEAEETARVKEKAINSKRVVEAGAVTKVKVEAKAEVRNWDVGILAEILHNVKASSNRLERKMVVSKKDTKEKAERPREE